MVARLSHFYKQANLSILSITGHSTREMFDRYNTIDEDDTRLAMSKFQGLVKSVDQNVDQVGFEQ